MNNISIGPVEIRHYALQGGLLLLSLLVLASLPSCFTGAGVRGYLYHPGRWDYVFELGGPKEITAWALVQTDPKRIVDGGYALCDLFAQVDQNAVEADQAVDGYVKIVRKMEGGWPGCVVSTIKEKRGLPIAELPEPERVREIGNILSDLYNAAAGAYGGAGANRPSFKDDARRAFFRVPPHAENADYLTIWRTIGHSYVLTDKVDESR